MTPTTPGDDSKNRRREREVVVDIDNLGTAPDAPTISGKTADADSYKILDKDTDQKAPQTLKQKYPPPPNTRTQDQVLIVNNKTQSPEKATRYANQYMSSTTPRTSAHCGGTKKERVGVGKGRSREAGGATL
jgi:hypothetical protein